MLDQCDHIDLGDQGDGINAEDTNSANEHFRVTNQQFLRTEMPLSQEA